MSERMVKVQWQRFITVEAATLPPDERVVVISFGDEQSPVTQFAIPLSDARDMVAELICALAYFGDEEMRSIASVLGYPVPEDEE